MVKTPNKKMKNKTEPTETQEEAYLEENFPLEWPGVGKTTRSWKIREVQRTCAFYAHQTNALKEAACDTASGLTKLVVGVVPLLPVIAAYKYTNNFAEGTLVTGAIIVGSTVASFGLIPYLAYETVKNNLFGEHPFSGYGNYYKEPYFGVYDHFRFAANWLKIAKMQHDGKIRRGTKKLSEMDYFSVRGGP